MLFQKERAPLGQGPLWRTLRKGNKTMVPFGTAGGEGKTRQRISL
jgi:hypothetical protein